MIAWKADIGIGISSFMTRMSQINFTDVDRVWGFPIASKRGGFISEVGEAQEYNYFLSNYYELCTQYLGNEINTLYSGTIQFSSFTIDRTWLRNLLVQIPSLSKMYPNLWAQYLNNSDNSSFVVYIKQLNRVLQIFNNSPSIWCAVYSVDSSNSLTRLAYFTSFDGYFTAWTSGSNGAYANIPCLLKYTTVEDLKSVENYNIISIYYGPQQRGGTSYSGVGFQIDDFKPVNNLKNNFQGMLDALFGGDDIDPPIVIVPPVNPYEPQPPSGQGELPPGTFDDTSDPIPDSPLPTLSAANTGFTRIYNPTLAQVQSLARYLWTDESVVQTIWNKIKQYFEDPMQAILGFNLVPVPVPDGGQEEFALMYIPTGVTMTVAANQFVDVDCGTLTLDRYYGSALDQSPYTKIHAFLPFIGTVRLNTDEVMGTTLSVKYRVDIVSGSCVAKIFVDGSCLYQYSGHCAITIPISSADFSTYVSAAINVAKTAAMGAIGASAGISMPPGVLDTMIGGGVSGGLAPSNGAPLSEYLPPVGPQPGDWQLQPPSQVPSNISPSSIANTVAQVSGGKPYIEHSGSFSGNSGYLGIRRPFLIIERPNMCLPEKYQSLNGYPSMITLQLGECSGYTRIQQVQLTGMPATSVEQAEIMGLLKGGVVF